MVSLTGMDTWLIVALGLKDVPFSRLTCFLVANDHFSSPLNSLVLAFSVDSASVVFSV